jgi:hypothetical protein
MANGNEMLTRRRALGMAGAATYLPKLRAAAGKRILLRSSWQSVNIGDIGHTPGALSLLWKHLPGCEITLWPGKLGHGSRELLTRGYPKLKIAEGGVGDDGKPTTPELRRAWEEADLYLSGSGSNFPASNHALAFRRATGKPVGVFGVTLDAVSGFGEGRLPEGGTLEALRAKAKALPVGHLKGELREVIDGAAFFFCRDTLTRDYLQAQGVQAKVVEFGPDAQIGMHLRDDAKAEAWMRATGLWGKDFIAVVPRLRYTPYYQIDGRARVESDVVKDAINERTVESDHAKLREMMVEYVRKTGRRVMVCAEMTYQVEMGKRVLVDPLPADVRENVVWRDTYWLPDEAASVYARAEAVVSIECHSPLIALQVATPMIHVRQPTDTWKGQMYRDLGAGDWFFEVEETTGKELWGRLEAIVRDRAKARRKAKEIQAFAAERQKRMVEVVGRAL